MSSPKLPLAATPETIERARAFIMRAWAARATELGRDKPADLSGSCKLSSMFAQRVFGGTIQGNRDHQFLRLDNCAILDLNEGAADVAALAEPYQHDRRFWNNREHRESMASCLPRVERWVAEFLAEQVV